MRQRLVLFLGTTAGTACTVWALWPVRGVSAVETALSTHGSAVEEESAAAPIDAAAFGAKIWNPKPPEPEIREPPMAVAAKSAPPTLQLVGIVREQSDGPACVQILRAALYDPDSGRFHLVRSGECIGDVTIESVDESGVNVDRGGRAARLTLRDREVGSDGR